jgi:putative DNA primase/helicase
MNALWQNSVPIAPTDPAGRYLEMRTGVAEFPDCLRFVDRLRYRDETSSSWHPGLIAMVVDASGKPVNIHRTYLTPVGTKAALSDPRRMMPGELPRGCAIRLAEAGATLAIAEGIETALSVTALFDVPCWSVINKAMMAKWTVPPDVRELIIFADNDANYRGQAAAYELANRVVKSSLGVAVRVPPIGDTDWNDVHQQRLQTRAA